MNSVCDTPFSVDVNQMLLKLSWADQKLRPGQTKVFGRMETIPYNICLSTGIKNIYKKNFGAVFCYEKAIFLLIEDQPDTLCCNTVYHSDDFGFTFQLLHTTAVQQETL